MKLFLKTHNIIILIFLLMLVGLAYVNQQVLIYQMGLKVKENGEIYSKLVDQNRISLYNVLNLKSPLNLEKKLLARKMELNMPHKWQVVKLESPPLKFARKDMQKQGLFANLFMMGREAEASPNLK